MKTLPIVFLLAVSACTIYAQSGGPYEIKSAVMAGGGVTARSSDSHFALSGTFGQHEAAPRIKSADGHFGLEPGFWHGIAVVQLPGGPVLTVRPGASGYVVLSWPSSVSGFQLQSTEDLAKDAWQDVSEPVVDSRGEHTVTVRADGQVRLFRLHKP